KTCLVEAGVAEKMRTSKIRQRGKGAIGEPGEPLEHHVAQGNRRIEGRASEIDMRKRNVFEPDWLVDGETAQILDLATAQRMRKLGEQAVHVLLAAPAGGPAKACANGPMATMSTSTSCGPPASSARSSASAKSSTSATR